jgi:hypothetical protein
MDKKVIDLAEMGILSHIFHKREIGELKQQGGLAFLFNRAGELLYIECITSRLDAAIYAYQQEMEYIALIHLEAGAANLESVKELLVRAYYPKNSHFHSSIRTIHSGCLARRELEPAAGRADVREEKIQKAFWGSDRAAEHLHLSVDMLFFYCEHLTYSGYSFGKDSHRRYVFLERDLDLLQVFINLLQREVPLKRAAKEAVKLAKKFGIKEALRLSTFRTGSRS